VTNAYSADGTRVYPDGIRQPPYNVDDRVQVGPLVHSTGTIVVRSREVFTDGRKPAVTYDVRMDSGNLVKGALARWFTRLDPVTYGNAKHKAAFDEYREAQ
jgi:hypothetical protein